MSNKPRVAICQSGIIPGGRLRVILSVVDILNDMDIIPDVLTSRLSINPADINIKYGWSGKINYRLLPRIPKLSQEYFILVFNLMMSYYARNYDLLINTSNSLAFLPQRKDILTYMFFPRKRRITANTINIHQPNTPMSFWSRKGLRRAILRMTYRLSKPQPDHQIVCMTKYTRSILKQEYGLSLDLPVVYPPVDVAKYCSNGRKTERAIVTVGRFDASKRQLDQIKLAERLTEIPFHIVGFTGDGVYYKLCQQYVAERQLNNVHLHPDASFEQMKILMQTSKFFLHTLINEPFGLTAVQAIAAGCLPIVHDSGGQRETVPDPNLRYQNLDQVPTILNSLDKLNTSEAKALTLKLQNHIKFNFDEKIFYREMKLVLSSYLKRSI
jgi:glycosyltransferase involved in cell wall biosynthesis